MARRMILYIPVVTGPPDTLSPRLPLGVRFCRAVVFGQVHFSSLPRKLGAAVTPPTRLPQSA